MTALEFSNKDMAIFADYAAKSNMSVADYVRRAVLEYIDREKVAQNAEYIAMLQKSEKEFAKGKFVTKTTEELEQLIHG